MSQADWETYVPRLVTAARVELGSTFAIHLQEALTTGVRPSEHDVPVASEENAVVWRLLTTSGHDGIPDSLTRRIPSHMKNGWLGIEACLWIRDQIIARGDREQRWCRTVMGRLNYFVRGTRWDVAFLYEMLRKERFLIEAYKYTYLEIT